MEIIFRLWKVNFIRDFQNFEKIYKENENNFKSSDQSLWQVSQLFGVQLKSLKKINIHFGLFQIQDFYFCLR